MTANQREVIRVRGWRAEPTGDDDDYYVYNAKGELTGLARSEKAAREWLDESTGINYEKLPAVKRSELTAETGTRIPLGEFPCRGWYQHTVYKYQGKEVARIQTKQRYGKFRRTEVLTLSGQACVTGSNLAWAVKEAGYRLIDD